MILGGAHLIIAPVHGRQWRAPWDSKWPAMLGGYLCGRVPGMFCWFQRSLSFVQKGFYCLQASKAAEGEGDSACPVILCCAPRVPLGAVCKKL